MMAMHGDPWARLKIIDHLVPLMKLPISGEECCEIRNIFNEFSWERNEQNYTHGHKLYRELLAHFSLQEILEAAYEQNFFVQSVYWDVLKLSYASIKELACILVKSEDFWNLAKSILDMTGGGYDDYMIPTRQGALDSPQYLCQQVDLIKLQCCQTIKDLCRFVKKKHLGLIMSVNVLHSLLKFVQGFKHPPMVEGTFDEAVMRIFDNGGCTDVLCDYFIRIGAQRYAQPHVSMIFKTPELYREDKVFQKMQRDRKRQIVRPKIVCRGCGEIEGKTKFKLCDRCKCTYWCGRKCFKKHWKQHKKVCQKHTGVTSTAV